jgi:predicted DCC family thiol-disulfide oxidoreductase YuxK
MRSTTNREYESRPVLIYDGECALCRRQVARLRRWARPGALAVLDLADPSVPERFPDLDRARLLTAMHLVNPDGRVAVGAEAAVRALASRPVLGRLARVYYVPGIRWLADRAYAFVARRRARGTGDACRTGDCGRERPRNP